MQLNDDLIYSSNHKQHNLLPQPLQLAARAVLVVGNDATDVGCGWIEIDIENQVASTRKDVRPDGPMSRDASCIYTYKLGMIMCFTAAVNSLSSGKKTQVQ